MANRRRYEQQMKATGVPTSATRGSHSKRSILHRTLALMVVCGVVMFIPLVWKLWDIAIVNHDVYQKAASDQWSLDYVVSAERGNIYDRTGNPMAMSATVYNLILSPNDLVKSVSNKDEEGNKLDDEVYNAKVSSRQDQMVEELMTLFPDLDREKVVKQVHNTKSSYWKVKGNIEEEDAEPLREYLTEHKTAAYLYLLPDTKRYYPYSSLAAQALGFVNANGGAYGIEAVYNDVLEGTAGRVTTTRTAGGTQRYNSYAEYIDAIDGYNLTLTIDTTIQSYLEKTLEEGIKDFSVQDGAFAIAMDPKTGAIYGIASSPDFDPNNYSTVVNDLLLSGIEQDTLEIYQDLKSNNSENLTDSELMAKASTQAQSNALNTQWRNKAIDSRYEPGSVFKAIVLAAALEEGVVSENDTFYCPGYAKVADQTINCSRRAPGHKSQTLTKAVQNSCNPAFIEIGRRLGKDKFYEYFEAFGMMENTGIDLPGEASLAGAVWDKDDMGEVELATASFGQRFEITPLQMICGFSAVVNGGYLVKPYVVQSISTQDGTLVQNTQPEIVRQVISEQTSQRASSILEQVVATGTGNNGYVAGYRIGGKTGTSEVKTQDKDHYIVSFMGYAPADDPKVIVLLAYDHPQVASPGSNYGPSGVYISGGNMAAKKAGPLIAQILDYLGIEKAYTKEEAAAADVSMPKVTGLGVPKAEDDLSRKNLKFRTVGEGSTVTRQVPAAGTSIPGGSTVILYLGGAAPEPEATVPNVTGMTYEKAKSTLENAGFFMRASGISTYYGNTSTAESQSVAANSTAAIGTIVDVRFFNTVEDGYTG